MIERRKAPVFVLGCHRSGTNLMHDMLVSAGGFAVKPMPLYVYEVLLPRFGSLVHRKNREELARFLLSTKAFRCLGIEPDRVYSRIVNDCRSSGDFLSVVTCEMVRLQNAQRWAVWGPDNVLHIPRIKKDIPEALFIHVIRDGRDVALALSKMKFPALRPPAMEPWPRPVALALSKRHPPQTLPWDGKRAVLTCALFWEKMVWHARRNGRLFPADYLEVHFEDLVGRPEETLARVGDFIGCPIDFGRVRTARLGTLAEPNSTFREELERGHFNPVGRWQTHLTEPEVREIESLIGRCLEKCGYPLSLPRRRKPGLKARVTRAVYPSVLDVKLWLKYHTFCGRFVSLRGLEVDNNSAALTTTAAQATTV